MCEITSDNFEQKFQEINYNLQKANYIAIDTEFTGLNNENNKSSLIDKSEQRYKKFKKNVKAFNLIQIGLCLFRYCNEQKIFVTDSYNFYIFPRNYGLNVEQTTSFQSSALEFLCKYNFDFNKLAYKGISYMNNKQEEILRAKLSKEILFSGTERDYDERLMQKICSEITDWLLKAHIGDLYELSEIKGIKDFIIHKELRNRFDSIWTRQDKSTIIVEKMSTEERNKLYQYDSTSEITKTIDVLLGFTRIFRLMIEYKKPLVFHNGFMDLLFMYESFYESLPETVGEFKQNINKLFPLIYDTKHMASNCKKTNKGMKDMFASTALENLFLSLNDKVAKKCALYMPSIKHSPTSLEYADQCRPHEAGYDAYMTGTIFLKLAHAIAHFDSLNCYNVRANTMNDYFLVVKSFENRIHLMKAAVDHVNLSGPDPGPFKLSSYIVKCKSGSLSIFQLMDDLSNVGEIDVVKLSKNSARITLDSYAIERLRKLMDRNDRYEFTRVSLLHSISNSNYYIGLGFLSAAIILAYSIHRSA